MKTTVSAFGLVLVLVLPVQAHGGIEVDPLPNSPGVSLDGIVINRPNQPEAGSNPGQPAHPAPVKDSWTPILSCRVDEVTGVYGCRADVPDEEPADEEADRPELTPGHILRAARTIGLPSLQVEVQPGGETLVNVPTIFYAEPRPFARSVDLLGYDVDLAATPVQYLWIHGDGTSRATSSPGSPYPAMDVTHRYREPADVVRPRVDVTYRVRFRVDGGPWQTLGPTLLASGPAAQLEVSEAAPVLTTR